MPDYLWSSLNSLANNLGISISQLVVRFCINSLEEETSQEEFESLQRLHQIDENIKMIKKLTEWGNQLRKSGAYAEKTLRELIQGGSPDLKRKIPLPTVCSLEELEATTRLFQHRYRIARETAKLILEEFPDLKIFNIGVNYRGTWDVYSKEITPETIAAALIDSLNPNSETPFIDWVKEQKKKMLYDFGMFDGIAKLFESESKEDEKDESDTE